MNKDEEKKTGDKVKEVMTERRVKKLMEYPQETLARFSCELEYEYSKLENKNEKLVSKIEKLEKKITQLENEKKPLHKYSGYPINKDYIAKLLFILSRNKGNVSFEEIVNAFYLLEPDLNERWREPNKSISKIISRACKFGIVIRDKIYGNHGSFVYKVLT